MIYCGVETLSDIIEQIESFSVLGPDWDSYGADPINRATIDLALEIASLLPGDWTVVPCGDGSIQFGRNGEAQTISVWAEESNAALAEQVSYREAVLLEVIQFVRHHPDFDNGGPMADAMDEALRGETPKILSDIAHLQRGLKPSPKDE